MALLTLRITGRELPGSACGEYRHIHVGAQRGKEPDQLVPADAAEAVFEIPVETVTASDGTTDYLTWAELPPGGEFATFRRAKLFLADLPDDALSGGAVETGSG
ncbi:DUF5990 family protein [Streptomyces sp. NPDC000880]